MSDLVTLIRERIGSEFDGECHLTEAEADALASRIAELERLKVDASNHAADAETVRRERDALQAELERLRREVEELKALFEQRWNTDLRAKKRWQDANPDKPNIWPSRDDLLVWLMDQHDEARKAAFIEAAEMASLSSSPSVYAFAVMIRAKAEGGNHG